MRGYTNSIAKVLAFTGLVYLVLTAFGGYALGNIYEIAKIGYYRNYTEFNWPLTIIAWVSGFMFSLLFFGVAEIVELLQLQKDETVKLQGAMRVNNYSDTKTITQVNNVKTFDDLPEL